MFSLTDVVLILGIILLIFGPGKLPQIGGALGKSIRGFKKELQETKPAQGAAKRETGSEQEQESQIAAREKQIRSNERADESPRG